MKTLRAEVNAVLSDLPATRRPFLRRSLRPDWLLCTDLPSVASAETVTEAARRLAALGWRTTEADGLLELDKLPDPPEAAPATETAGELACLISMLERHPGCAAEPLLLRAWLKALEAGQTEKLLRQWHRDWAVRLRRREALPGGLLPWLRAYGKETNE